MSLFDRLFQHNSRPADPVPAHPPTDSLDVAPPSGHEIEPTLHPIAPGAPAPAGAHLDPEPTREFLLPTAATILPIGERPTAASTGPAAAPRSPMRMLGAARERWIPSSSPRTARAPTVNVLVLDREECSCYLVKSILLGHRFGVSISTSIEDASAKMATGLFDILFADLGDGEGPEAEFIRGVNAELPALPVIALCREEAPHPAGCTLTVKLRKPVRVGQVNDAARLAALQTTMVRPEGRRKASPRLKVRVEIASGPILECVLTSVSLSGLLLESAGTAFQELQEFQEFFTGASRDPVQVDIDLAGRPPMHLTARRAFAETTPDHKLRQVGLAIAPAAEEREALRGLIAQVA